GYWLGKMTKDSSDNDDEPEARWYITKFKARLRTPAIKVPKTTVIYNFGNVQKGNEFQLTHVEEKDIMAALERSKHGVDRVRASSNTSATTIENFIDNRARENEAKLKIKYDQLLLSYKFLQQALMTSIDETNIIDQLLLLINLNSML
ncbi:unnamed protein product, partial [Didymodactylos carnosus]